MRWCWGTLSRRGSALLWCSKSGQFRVSFEDERSGSCAVVGVSQLFDKIGLMQQSAKTGQNLKVCARVAGQNQKEHVGR